MERSVFLYIRLLKRISIPRAFEIRCRHAGRLWCITIYVCQTTAIIERTIINVGHTIWNRDGNQTTAIHESFAFNSCHSVWNDDGSQTAATFKSIETDACYAFRNCDGFQTTTSAESTIVYACHAVWDGDRG